MKKPKSPAEIKDAFYTALSETLGEDAFTVVAAVQSTFAGDNFLAGFASELIRGSEVEETLKFANTCGAICTTAVGAGAALQNREQVVAFMEDTKRIDQAIFEAEEEMRNGGIALDANEAFAKLDAK